MARNQQGFNGGGRFTGQHGGPYRHHQPDPHYRAERDRNAYGREHSDGDRDDGHFPEREWDRQNRGGPFWTPENYGDQRARWMQGPSERSFKNEGDWDAGKSNRSRQEREYSDERRYGSQSRYRDDDQGYGPTTGGEFGPGDRYRSGNRDRDERYGNDRGYYNRRAQDSRGMYRTGDDDYRYSPSPDYAERDEYGRFTGPDGRSAGYRYQGDEGGRGRSTGNRYRDIEEEERYARWREDRQRNREPYRDVF